MHKLKFKTYFSKKRRMRRQHIPYKYPTLCISIILMLSLICAHYLYPFISTKSCLLIATICWGTSVATYLFGIHRLLLTSKHLRLYSLCKSSIIFLCIFSMGFTRGVTSERSISSLNTPYPLYTTNQLSPIDRCKLNSQAMLTNLREEMKTHGIEHQELAIISAMTLGDKSMLTPETKNTFSITGASHVLAISGLHIGLIFQLFVFILGGKRNIRHSIPLSLTLVWAYVFLIGAPASAIRSATMLSVYSFALIAKRPSININNLSLAFIFLLMAYPPFLFEISFQMSFLAVGAILWLYKPITSLIHPHNRLKKWAWSITAISISAQIGTIPIIIYYFGRISCFSLLTNFIAIPAATIILYFTVTLWLCLLLTSIPIISPAFSLISTLIAKVLHETAHITNESLSLFSLLPGANIENIKISILQLYLIYMSIAAGYLLIHKLHRCHSHRNHPLASFRKDYNSQANQT